MFRHQNNFSISNHSPLILIVIRIFIPYFIDIFIYLSSTTVVV